MWGAHGGHRCADRTCAEHREKAQAFKQSSGKTQLYAQPSVPVDADNDGKITQADWSGWRNFLGLPYVMSLQPSLLSEAAQLYYEKP